MDELFFKIQLDLKIIADIIAAVVLDSGLEEVPDPPGALQLPGSVLKLPQGRVENDASLLFVQALNRPRECRRPSPSS